MLNRNIVKPSMAKILTTPTSKRLLKITETNKIKKVRVEKKKFTSPKSSSFLQNKSNLDILILAPSR